MGKFYEELGLKKVSDELYVYEKGEGVYRKVKGVSVKIDYAEKYDFFLVRMADKYLLVEGITGEIICEGVSTTSVIECCHKKLIRGGLIAFERDVAIKVFREGKLSPSYRIEKERSKGICRVCGENPSLPHEEACFVCMCVAPHETIRSLLRRIH